MTRFFCVIFLLFILSTPTYSQAADNQRTGVLDKSPFACTFSLSTAYTASEDSGTPCFKLDASPSIGIIAAQTISLEASLPFNAIIYTELGQNNIASALGDPEIILMASFRTGDWQLSAEGSYTHPWGVWNSYQAERRKLQSGSGYKSLGLRLSAHRYMDPLVAGFSFGAEHCFDKVEQYGIASLPLVVKIGFFASEALNGSTAVCATVLQSLASAHMLDGFPLSQKLDYSISGSASLLFHAQNSSISIGISKSLSDLSSPIAIRTEVSYTLKEGVH